MAETVFATRTLRAMEVLVFRPSSARQLASELRIDARTARRLLNRLVEDGWATRIEGRERGAAARLEIPSYRSALALVLHDDTCRFAPAHADAGGKVLLAYREAWRDSVLEQPLERLTAATIVDPDELRSECGQIRREQVAFEREEVREGRFAMAAAVRDAFDTAPPALVLVSDDPFQPHDPRRPALEEAARDLSAVIRDEASHVASERR
jgi:DNA-binding IclR family transcriptional regulator